MFICLPVRVQEGEDDWWDAEEPVPEGYAPSAPGDSGPSDGEPGPSDGDAELSDDSADEGMEPEDDDRYRDMLAAATGGSSEPRAARKRRHDVVVTEAYPESEFNLNPNAATAGTAAVQYPLSILVCRIAEPLSHLVHPVKIFGICRKRNHRDLLLIPYCESRGYQANDCESRSPGDFINLYRGT